MRHCVPRPGDGAPKAATHGACIDLNIQLGRVVYTVGIQLAAMPAFCWYALAGGLPWQHAKRWWLLGALSLPAAPLSEETCLFRSVGWRAMCVARVTTPKSTSKCAAPWQVVPPPDGLVWGEVCRLFKLQPFRWGQIPDSERATCHMELLKYQPYSSLPEGTLFTAR